MRALHIILSFAMILLVLMGAERTRAQTIQVDRYSDVREALLQMEMVIFDLDSTLVRSERMFGSDAWFDREWQEGQRLGMTYDEARRSAEEFSDRIQSSVNYDPVESSVVSLVRELQAKGIVVMILTARRAPQVEGALRALRETGIDMRVTAPVVAKSSGLLYIDGVLFANGDQKGPVLDRLMKSISVKPRSMAFVDDKLHNLTSVIDPMRIHASTFLAVHYTGVARYNARFRRDVSDYQKSEFLAGRTVPSDQEALASVRAGGLCRQLFMN